MAVLATIERQQIFHTPGAPPICTPGDTKCDGYDLYTCSLIGQWELTKHNSTECGYTPPTPPEKKPFPWSWIAIGGGIIILITVVAVSQKK